MNYRRIWYLLLAVCLALFLVGCGSSMEGALDVDEATKAELGVGDKDTVFKVWTNNFFLIDYAEGRSFDEIADRVENDTQTNFNTECIYTTGLVPNTHASVYGNYSYLIVGSDRKVTEKLRRIEDQSIEDYKVGPSPALAEIVTCLASNVAFPFEISNANAIPDHVRVSRCEIYEHLSLGNYIYYQTNQGDFVFFAPNDRSAWYLFPAEEFYSVARDMYDNVLEQTANGTVFGGVNLTDGLDLSEWQLQKDA